jgi:hypothetical protein
MPFSAFRHAESQGFQPFLHRSRHFSRLDETGDPAHRGGKHFAPAHPRLRAVFN